MIEWLRNKFSSAISFFFVLTVIVVTISGGVVGYTAGKTLGGWHDNYGGIGCIIGLALGCGIGIISGILTYGFFATVIHISETTDALLAKTGEDSRTLRNIANNTNNVSDAKQDKNDTGAISGWVCTKCCETNP